ncbi:MAG TPA: oligosaccharide flippase family protein [Rhodanobacteraceae bacterium]|nr:oligosaccharide flippase family protein [Rhodanobacteraceae bacterium]
MNTRATTFRNTLFASAGIYTEYLLGMVASIIIARHLGPRDFGAYSLIIWMVAIGVAVANSGTASAAIKFIAELRGSGREDMVEPMLAYLRRVQRLFLAVVMAAGVLVLWVAGDELLPGLNRWAVAGLLALVLALRAPYMFDIGVTKGFERFGSTAAVALIGAPLNLALVLLAWYFGSNVAGYLAVFAISSVVFFAAANRQVRNLTRPLPPSQPLPPELRRRVRRHLRIVAATVTIGFFSASEVEVLFLNLHGHAAAAGEFKVAFQLAKGAALLVPGVFSAVLLPLMAYATSRGGSFGVQRFIASTTYLVVLAVPLVAFGALFAGSIMGLLYGAEYTRAAPVFALCLLSTCITTVAAGASSMLLSADRQHDILGVTIACGALKVLLDALLIARFGLGGAMAAYTTEAVIGAVAMIALALRGSSERLAWGRLARIVAAGALAAAIASPLRGELPAIGTLLAGGAVVCAAYLLLTFLLGCWSRDDIGYMRVLLRRYTGRRLRPLTPLLGWAEAHATEDR